MNIFKSISIITAITFFSGCAGKKDQKSVSNEVEVKNEAEVKSSLTNENTNITNP